MGNSSCGYAITTVLLLIFLSGCTRTAIIDDSNLTQNEDTNPPAGEFEDFMMGGTYFYQTDWKRVGDAVDNTDNITEYESIYGPVFGYLSNMLSVRDLNFSKCVNNRETYECLFVYAILNDREDICNYFPESRNVSWGAKYGPFVVTQYYKDACIAQVRMFRGYLEGSDKISFCQSFTQGSFSRYKCIEYTALTLNDSRLCNLTDQDVRYGCYYTVLCHEFPYTSEEMYKCRLHACDISGEDEGCRIMAEDSNPLTA